MDLGIWKMTWQTTPIAECRIGSVCGGTLALYRMARGMSVKHR
jgi:hypothetical protein